MISAASSSVGVAAIQVANHIGARAIALTRSSNKRGALLMVSAERLEEVCAAPLVRIGLSATVAPLATVAEFLVGPARDCWIAEVTERKAARIDYMLAHAAIHAW